MATATKDAPKRQPRPKFKCGVKFKNVSYGDQTASVGITISRDEMSVVQADDYLCGKRNNIRIVCGSGANVPEGQKKLDGMNDVDHEVEAVVDFKGYSVKLKDFTSKLTFNLSDIKGKSLEEFAKRVGKLYIVKVAVLDQDTDTDTDDDEDDDDVEE